MCHVHILNLHFTIMAAINLQKYGFIWLQNHMDRINTIITDGFLVNTYLKLKVLKICIYVKGSWDFRALKKFKRVEFWEFLVIIFWEKRHFQIFIFFLINEIRFYDKKFPKKLSKKCHGMKIKKSFF